MGLMAQATQVGCKLKPTRQGAARNQGQSLVSIIYDYLVTPWRLLVGSCSFIFVYYTEMTERICTNIRSTWKM